ncbi:MAG: hypothetical protein M3460_26325 [Actinomycetota bacterium]|nr:hypothetical protein [Actinomycetota bacterium]
MCSTPSTLRVALQGVTLATVVLVCVVGLAGPRVTERDLAPWVFYIIFWVGLVPASLLLDPVWRVLNPLRGSNRGVPFWSRYRAKARSARS